MVATKAKLDGYFLANAKLNPKIGAGFSVYFAVENLANRQYQTLYLYPAPGRTYRGGIRFDM